MYDNSSRKAQAFARFAAKHPRYNGAFLRDFFYDQACIELGICNHSLWVKLDPNDERWDKVCQSEEVRRV